MELIFLKACPKCGGDLIVERDSYGRYSKCLQCGRSEELEAARLRSRLQPLAPEEKDAA